MTAERRGSFGALLRGYRISAGLTQEALADRAGLSARGIADLERGARRFPHFHTLRRLAEALELAPDDRVALVAAGQRRPGSAEAGSPSAAARRCARCGRENAPGARFGVPVAHEDHARRGVLAALGLQRRLNEPWAAHGVLDSDWAPSSVLRMALNTGLVAVGHIGTGPERRLSAVGETTTVAGLLQQRTELGTIVIGAATARMVTGYVRLEELGPVPLRGGGGSLVAFRVTGVGPRRSPIEGLGARPLSQFVGRDLEMSTLRDVLGQVAASPEMSARRLLSHFIGRDDELAALRGPLAKMEAGHGQVVGVVGEPGIGKSRLLYEFRRSLGDRQISYLEGRCLSYGGSIPYLPIVDVVRANCGIVEDDAPAAVAGKVRFGLQEVGLDADRHAPYVLRLLGLGEGAEALRRLGPRDSLCVVRSVLGADRVPEALARVILERGEGNPFFLEELARAAVEHGEEGAGTFVPDTIQGVLMARMDRLAETPRRVLQTASVLGREVPLRLLE